MIVAYTHREKELNVRGQMLVDVKVTGTITHEGACSDWAHDRCMLVEMRMHNGFRAIKGRAAKAVYEAFCEARSAADLAANNMERSSGK